MSDERKRKIDAFINEGSWYLPNLVNTTTSTSRSVTPATSSTSVTNSPTRTTNSESYIDMPEEVRLGAQEERDRWMQEQGFARNAKGEWVANDSSLGSVLNMRKHQEEVERVNKAKALNAGLFNAVATLGDMISAVTGGNVYRREKNTIAEDAAKDTIARRDALVAAEASAKEKERERLIDALQKAQTAHDKYLDLHGIRRNKQTAEGFVETRTTTNSGGTTVGTQEQHSPARVSTTPLVVYGKDGSADNMLVNSSLAQAYVDRAWTALQKMDLTKNSTLLSSLSSKGYIDKAGKLKPSLKNEIINDADIYAILPQDVQQMNRELYKHSEAFGRYVNSEQFKNLPIEQQEAYMNQVLERINGRIDDGGFNPNIHGSRLR